MINPYTEMAVFAAEYVVLFWVLLIWSAVWKGIALWKTGRHNQLVWFVCIFIFNTIGILPIIYLVFFQKKEKKLRKKR